MTVQLVRLCLCVEEDVSFHANYDSLTLLASRRYFGYYGKSTMQNVNERRVSLAVRATRFNKFSAHRRETERRVTFNVP